MNCRNNLDWDKPPGSDSTDNSQASLLPSLLRALQLGCVQSVQCPRCRGWRRDARCRRWIEECENEYTIAPEDRDRDQDQNGDEDEDPDGALDGDRDGDVDGDADGDGDGDRDGDSSTWWIQCTNQDDHCYLQSCSPPSEPPAPRQSQAFAFQWPHPLELALDVSAGLALISLLGEEDSGMLLPPLFLFILYLMLTLPLAMVLGCRRRSGRQSWRQQL